MSQQTLTQMFCPVNTIKLKTLPSQRQVFITLANKNGLSIFYHHLSYRGIPDFKQFLELCITRFKMYGIANMQFENTEIIDQQDWEHIIMKCQYRPVIDVQMKVCKCAQSLILYFFVFVVNHQRSSFNID